MNAINISTIPFLYQSERLSYAWGHIHYGFFIDPNGVKYGYKMDKNYRYASTHIWNWYEKSKEEKSSINPTSWGYEENGVIMPSKLFENLANSIEYKPWFRRKKAMDFITSEMINDLLQSRISHYGRIMCDSGYWSNSLYIYEPNNKYYRRILLSCEGDIKKTNESPCAKMIEMMLGTVK